MSRVLFLVRYRPNSWSRAHFGIFVPSTFKPSYGTLIHVVGAPMTGFALEFQRGVEPQISRSFEDVTALGHVLEDYVKDPPQGVRNLKDSNPKDLLESAASKVEPPRISQNFMAPVNDTTNKRCQEWTMEYLNYLVHLNILDTSAIQTAQALRDAPEFGTGLRNVNQNQAQPAQAAAASQVHSAYAQPAASPNPQEQYPDARWDNVSQRWVAWDHNQGKWMVFNGEQWVSIST